MKFEESNDAAILSELGLRLQRERLNRNIAQKDLALAAGLSRRALQNLESGRPCTTASLIRILRALGMLDALDAFLPLPGISPIQLARLQGRERRRAGAPRAEKKGADSHG